MKDIYSSLKEHLYNISTGFPDTESGIEIEILQKLFTEEDAKLFMALSPLPEKISDVDEKILKETLACEKCGKNYQVTPAELKFYQKQGIPVPRKTPNRTPRMVLPRSDPRHKIPIRDD